MKKISIIGLGYVGLPLALMLSKNYKVVGFDINQNRINQLLDNFDINKQHAPKEINSFNKKNNFTSDSLVLKNSSIFIITVPTPVKKNKPDLSLLKNATIVVSKYLNKKSIVIYESTVYPGITEGFCKNILESKSNLKYKKDFHLAYSPERVNPGDKKKTIDKITKLVAASDKKTLIKVERIYKSFLKNKVYKVDSIKVAEAAKVIENAQRDLNIAFMNELKEILDISKINVFEVLNAAKTKWNFLNFEPGLVGGHCIGVDPYYLAEFAKKNNVKPRVILSGRETNERVTNIYFKNILNKLNKFSNPKILVLGLTFKENCTDIRNSKVIDLCNSLIKKNINVSIYDPWVSLDDKKKLKFNFHDKLPLNLNVNLIFIAVKHKIFCKLKYERIMKISSLKRCEIIDIKNIFHKNL